MLQTLPLKNYSGISDIQTIVFNVDVCAWIRNDFKMFQKGHFSALFKGTEIRS